MTFPILQLRRKLWSGRKIADALGLTVNHVQRVLKASDMGPTSSWWRAQWLRRTVYGAEKRCRKCKAWWPAETSCFQAHPKGQGGLHNRCRACVLPAKRAMRRAA